ncbi:unnamed protein product [Trichogramma brassicae]|uniref:Uncharacterized protein n=1 Tax=Trichogramma brassicae TaxID=86971 RepID=A0A6H5ISJ8_9HYME|nr:unnamed protein product [Trichogramma brassicae]
MYSSARDNQPIRPCDVSSKSITTRITTTRRGSAPSSTSHRRDSIPCCTAWAKGGVQGLRTVKRHQRRSPKQNTPRKGTWVNIVTRLQGNRLARGHMSPYNTHALVFSSRLEPALYAISSAFAVLEAPEEQARQLQDVDDDDDKKRY